jgi:hypothetical protein
MGPRRRKPNKNDMLTSDRVTLGFSTGFGASNKNEPDILGTCITHAGTYTLQQPRRDPAIRIHDTQHGGTGKCGALLPRLALRQRKRHVLGSCHEIGARHNRLNPPADDQLPVRPVKTPCCCQAVTTGCRYEKLDLNTECWIS